MRNIYYLWDGGHLPREPQLAFVMWSFVLLTMFRGKEAGGSMFKVFTRFNIHLKKKKLALSDLKMLFLHLPAITSPSHQFLATSIPFNLCKSFFISFNFNIVVNRDPFGVVRKAEGKLKWLQPLSTLAWVGGAFWVWRGTRLPTGRGVSPNSRSLIQRQNWKCTCTYASPMCLGKPQVFWVPSFVAAVGIQHMRACC